MWCDFEMRLSLDVGTGPDPQPGARRKSREVSMTKVSGSSSRSPRLACRSKHLQLPTFPTWYMYE